MSNWSCPEWIVIFKDTPYFTVILIYSIPTWPGPIWLEPSPVQSDPDPSKPGVEHWETLENTGHKNQIKAKHEWKYVSQWDTKYFGEARIAANPLTSKE